MNVITSQRCRARDRSVLSSRVHSTYSEMNVELNLNLNMNFLAFAHRCRPLTATTHVIRFFCRPVSACRRTIRASSRSVSQTSQLATFSARRVFARLWSASRSRRSVVNVGGQLGFRSCAERFPRDGRCRNYLAYGGEFRARNSARRPQIGILSFSIVGYARVTAVPAAVRGQRPKRRRATDSRQFIPRID